MEECPSQGSPDSQEKILLDFPWDVNMTICQGAMRSDWPLYCINIKRILRWVVRRSSGRLRLIYYLSKR
jgi:hypothetical protein